PFYAVYGRDPPPLLPYETRSTNVEAMEHVLLDRDEMLNELKMSLPRAQHKMKHHANEARKDVKFDVGDLVYLKLRPYRLQTLAQRRNEKLAARYYGLYPVVAKVGVVAYHLELPLTAQLRPIFHVSQLCRAIGSSNSSWDIPKQLTLELELVSEPNVVLAIRRTPAKVMEVLIAWKDMPLSDATWEVFDKVQLQFLSYHLEDKVLSLGGSNDKPPIRFTYVKREQRSSGEG
ncbi:Chromo domain-like, partial [Parasponia andersonii]